MIYLFGECELNPGLHELRRDGQVCVIEPQVFDLLLYLIENRDRVLGKAELNQHIWEGRFVSDASLTTCLKSARQAIGDTGKRQHMIRTFPRRGIRFVAAVEQVESTDNLLPDRLLAAVPPIDSMAASKAKGENRFIRPIQRLSTAIVSVLVLLAALAAMIAWNQLRHNSLEAASIDKSMYPLPDKPSIVVLPFTNLSGDKSQEYFADGMTDDLITDLSKISGLIVIARNSAFTYKGRNVKVQDVAEDLNVSHILEGSVRKLGKNIRINAQLIDTNTGNHLWADRYDGKIDDLFDLQDRVMKRIVGALSQNIALPSRSAVNKNANPVALKLYWQGRSDLFKLKGLEFGRLGPSIKSNLRRALELDADNPEIQATLGWLHYLGSRQGRTFGGAQFSAVRARQLAERSLQIKKTGPAMMLKAAIFFEDDRRPTDAIKLGEKAIDLAPNDWLNLEILASMLLRVGRVDEALERLVKVRRLDPHGSLGQQGMGLGLALFLAGNAEAAIPILNYQSTSELVGYIPVEYFYLTAALSSAGRSEEASAMSGRYVKRCRSPDFQLKTHMLAWCNLFALKNALLFTFKFQNEDIISPLLKELRKSGFPEEPE